MSARGSSPLDKVASAKQFVKPQAQGAKDTVKQVASGAAKGAATAGVAGAVKGAAVGFAKTRAGRNVILFAVSILAVVAIGIPVFLGMVMTSVLTGALGASNERSGVSVESHGISMEALSGANSQANAYGVPWPIYLAVQKELGEEKVDGAKLRDALSAYRITTLGVGAVNLEGSGLVPGRTEKEQRDAETEKTLYIEALQEYGLDERQAGKAYNNALMWYLGVVETCSPTGKKPNPVPVGNDQGASEGATTDIPLPDGTTYSMNSAQVHVVQTIIATAGTIEGMTPEALVIALSVAAVESNFQNYANSGVPESLSHPHDAVGSDHDSLGPFQQRLHWAPKSERDGGAKAAAWLMNVENQTRAFFGGSDGPNAGSPRGLFDLTDPTWDKRENAGQDVQVSAFPERYVEEYPLAEALLAKFGDGAISACGGGLFAGTAGHPLGDVNWPLSDGFGARNVAGCSYCSTNHRGIDFQGGGAACNMPIYAIADGTATFVGENGGYGNVVRIDHGGGLESMYAHQPYGSEQWWPAEGSQVKSGQVIGRVGTTGNSQGCHLHFEIMKDGEHVDPANVLQNEMGLPLFWLEESFNVLPPANMVGWYDIDTSKKLE